MFFCLYGISRRLTPITGAYGPKGINFLAKMKRVFGAGELAKIVAEGVVWRNKAVDPTGFINFGARYYDPLTGRFLSCDPLVKAK